MAWANGKVGTRGLLRNWLIVYTGNFVGSVATALIMFFCRQYTFSGGAVGVTALNIAAFKSSLGFVEAVALGIMCNALVCWRSGLPYSAHSDHGQESSPSYFDHGLRRGGLEHWSPTCTSSR
jgi:formate/nitrite transporter FocA (FNT family)